MLNASPCFTASRSEDRREIDPHFTCSRRLPRGSAANPCARHPAPSKSSADFSEVLGLDPSKSRLALAHSSKTPSIARETDPANGARGELEAPLLCEFALAAVPQRATRRPRARARFSAIESEALLPAVPGGEVTAPLGPFSGNAREISAFRGHTCRFGCTPITPRTCPYSDHPTLTVERIPDTVRRGIDIAAKHSTMVSPHGFAPETLNNANPAAIRMSLPGVLMPRADPTTSYNPTACPDHRVQPAAAAPVSPDEQPPPATGKPSTASLPMESTSSTRSTPARTP